MNKIVYLEGKGLTPSAIRSIEGAMPISEGCTVELKHSAQPWITKWEAELGTSFNPSQITSRPLPNVFECLITLDGANSPAAVYAQYRKCIPILCLNIKRERAVLGEIRSQNASQKTNGVAPVEESELAPCELREVKQLVVTETQIDTESDLPIAVVAKAIVDFLTFPAHRGKIFVVEGGDGAGKQTQVAMLRERLQQEGYPVKTLDFPNDRSRYGILIRELLSGQLGNIREVNPLMFAGIYGLNRYDTLPQIEYWLKRGCNVILDRYMTANFGHQASKYETDDERTRIIETLKTFELKWLGLPEADQVLYLDLPPDFAFRAMQKDATRKHLDMHETAPIAYKNRVRNSFLWCCANQPNWVEVPCVDGDERKSRDQVHDHIFNLLGPEFVNKQ